MPPLPRPTRRTILTAGLLLLTGAVVNVAVAWVLAGAPASWTPGVVPDPSIRISEPRASEEQRRAAVQLFSVPRHWPLPEYVSTQRGLGWRSTSAESFGDGSSVWRAFRVDAGWPAAALTVRAVMAPTPPTRREYRYSPSFEPPRWMLPGPDWYSGSSHRWRAPLTPIPAGFAINTLFYAVIVGAILALPLSVVPIRRRLRARRGRCAKCGYDLAGLAAPGGPPLRGGRDVGPAAPCPECGATR